MEKGKISALQMGVILYPTIIATAILGLSSITAKFAKNDVWISPIWASLIGFLAAYLAYQLHKLYPKQSIIQYSGRIVGFIPGKIIGLVLLFFYLQINGAVIREYAEFIIGVFLPHTPISVVMSVMVLLCVSATRGGIEVIGRTGQLFLPMLVLPLIFIILMLVTDVDFRNIFPVMEHGIMPSIKGALLPQAWFAEFFMITFILPFLTNGEKAMKWSMISTLAVLLTLVATNLITLSLYGGNLSRFVYPFMNAARYISKADFFENLESIIIVMWAFGVFVKLSFHLYATSIGFAQWLNLSDYKPIVIPVAYFSVLLGFWDLPNLAKLSHFFVVAGPFYMLLINIAIPVLLLIIAMLRKRMSMPKEDRPG